MPMGWGNVRDGVLSTVLARDSASDRESQLNSGFSLLEGVAQPERLAAFRMQIEGHAWHD
jgi:hypothetical protein